jgi:hypothetical protein
VLHSQNRFLEFMKRVGEPAFSFFVMACMAQTTTQKETERTIACRTVHPEDIAVGDHVAALHQSYQIGTYVWCGLDSHQFPPSEPIELTLRSNFEALEVKEICLPFVLCCDHASKVVVLDVRSTTIGCLSARFIEAYRKAEKAKSKKDSADSKKKGKKKKKKG